MRRSKLIWVFVAVSVAGFAFVGSVARGRSEESHPEREFPEGVEQMKERVHVLREMAHRAEVHDMHEVSEALRERAEEGERRLRRAQEKWAHRRAERKWAGRVERLHREADELEEAGKIEAAERLREEAERLDAKGRVEPEPAMPPFAHELLERQERLHQELRRLRAEVHNLRREIVELRKQLKSRRR